MNIPPAPPVAPLAPPPPQAGAAATAAPQGAAPPAPPRTFAELYNNPAADAHAGVYRPVLTMFAAEPAAGRYTPAEIRVALDNAGDGFLQAYLLLGMDDRTIAIHMVSCYLALLGMIASLWDGRRFGFLGEVVGPTAQPVEFPGAMAFDLSLAAVRVPTLNTMEARWTATAAAEAYLPPYAAADVDTELVRTCYSALLPFVAVHRCLAPLSMRQLWTVLGQPMVDSR